MSTKHSDVPEPPNRRIGWSIYMLSVFVSGLICGALALFRNFAFLSGGMWFGVAIIFGCVIAIVVNLVRPRYESTSGWWRAFYDFLPRQLPPPD